MDVFTLDLNIASLPMRLISIGIDRGSPEQEHRLFQHRHNFFEIHYIFRGECVTRIGDQLFTHRQNEIRLIAPGVYHSQKSFSSPFEKISIIFEVPAPPEPKDQSAAEVYLTLGKVRNFVCNADRMADTFKDLLDLLDDFDNRFYAIDELRIVTEHLILQLVQKISRNVRKSAPKTTLTNIRQVYLIDEFFNGNFNRNDGNELLAKKLCVSIRQLNRILQSLYGHNFREKLLEIRLEVAMDLLTSDKSISEIAEITGYSCSANFSTFIKNATGKTPSEIRAAQRKQADSDEPFRGIPKR